MSTDSSHDPPDQFPEPRFVPPGKIRVLFATSGWPSGMLDVASWAKRSGLADPIVLQFQPGHAACPPGGQENLDDRAFRDAILAVGKPFLEKLLDWNPHVVGFRLEGDEIEQVARCVRAVRLVCNAEIVLGGPTATSHPREVLLDSGADYVFAGEAEESFRLFLHLAWQRDSKDRQSEIPGLAYRHGGRTYHNTLPRDGYGRSLLDVDFPNGGLQMDHVPHDGEKSRRSLRNLLRPVTDSAVLVANRLDWSILEGFTRPLDSLYFTGGRGCPGSCTFCVRLHGRRLRVKPARQLIEEIEAADRLVMDGVLRVSRWKLFERTEWADRTESLVRWAAIYDEDFFLDRRRAVAFFRLWDQSPLKDRYRLSVQTNPVSLLGPDGRPRDDLFAWIDRVKPMVQLGAESFHADLLARWRKRHTLDQLERVLEALDTTRQDYTVFQLLTDFDSTPQELVETLGCLALAAYRHRRMRIAASPFTIPLYDSQTRKQLEFERSAARMPVGHFTDHLRAQPEWMDPFVAELADLADASLQFALNASQRDGALDAAFESVLKRIRDEHRRVHQDLRPGHQQQRMDELLGQAERVMDQIKEARFQAIDPPSPMGY